MSLRRDVHSAFDEVAPELGGMPERVVQTVIAEHRTRQRKERIVFRLRAPLSLVAVLLLVALVVAVFVGGRLVQDWSAQHQTNAGHSQLTPAQFQAEVARLEARPVNLPTLKATDSCPNAGSGQSAEFQYGDGPVYADGGNGPTTAWGNFFDIPYFTDPKLTGPVLVRARDLRSATVVVVFSGAGAYGPIVANDPALASPALHSELVLDAGHPTGARVNGYGHFEVVQGLPLNASGCFGFQIDGPGFVERFTAGT